MQTLESVKSAEKLMEALAIASKELQNAKDYQQALIEAEKRMVSINLFIYITVQVV